MNDFAEQSDRRVVAWLLALVVLFLLYGSLYPFAFSLPQKPVFSWILPGGLSAIRDTVLNVGIYLPAGFLLFYVLTEKSIALRLLLAAFSTALLSGSIEFLQSFDRGRVSSSIDLITNVAGGILGASAASLLRWRIPPTSALRAHPVAFSLIAIGIAARLYPFFPIVHLQQILLKAGRLTSFPPDRILFSLAEWLTIRVLLAAVLNRGTVTFEFFAVCLALPAAVFIVDQPVSGADFVGAIAALAIGHYLRPTARQIAPFLLCVLVVRELTPFRFSIIPQPFHWIPFASFLESSSFSVPVFLNKMFIYGTVVWSFDPGANQVGAVAILLAVLVALLELAQQYLPGRTPDITDPILVLVAGLAFKLARKQATAFNSL